MSETIPRRKVDEYAETLLLLSFLLKQEVAAELAAIDFSLPVAEVRDELIEVMGPICEASAQTSSAVAASFYEDVRAVSLGTAPREAPVPAYVPVPAPALEATGATDTGSRDNQRQAREPQPAQQLEQQQIPAPQPKQPAEQPDGFKAIAGSIGYDERATEAFIRDSVQHIVDKGADGVETVKTEMASRVGYQVRKSAGETVVVNGMRDSRRVRFARVPRPTRSYEDGCLFCQMLASRGFVYHTEGLAGLTSHYHDGCACMVVPGFGDNPKVEGYDPKRYKAASKEWQMRDHSIAEANRRERERMRGAGTSRRRRR